MYVAMLLYQYFASLGDSFSSLGFRLLWLGEQMWLAQWDEEFCGIHGP